MHKPKQFKPCSRCRDEFERLGELLKEAEERSCTDPLTKLPNRRAVGDVCRRIFAQAKRSESPEVSLIILDVDHFKKINDTYGHPVGDAVLRMIAKVIKRVVREGDMPARYGGEEFVLLLPDTDLEGACRLAERIREKIEKTSITSQGKQISVTASFGVAQWHTLPSAETQEMLFSRADRVLYEAKRIGRNQVMRAL